MRDLIPIIRRVACAVLVVACVAGIPLLAGLHSHAPALDGGSEELRALSAPATGGASHCIACTATGPASTVQSTCAPDLPTGLVGSTPLEDDHSWTRWTKHRSSIPRAPPPAL